MAKRKKGLYRSNKEAKVGDQIECPICHTKFTKIQYSQAFCSPHCKDVFWNARGDRHSYSSYPADDYDGDDHAADEDYGVAEYRG